MDLYPAIDLRAGRCVRLYQGDYDRETVYGDDPVAQARLFADAGSPWVHVVDLDAARSGEPVNRPVVAAIAAAVDVPVQTGGGVRDEVAAEARPVLSAMGKRITHLGPSGAGQLGKAANQIIVAGTLLAVSEAVAFAQKAGLPMPALHEALMGGAASSWMLDVLGKKMMNRDFQPAFAIKHQQKDLAIVLRTARENGVPLPGAALVHQLLSALEAQGRGEEGTQALLTLYEQMTARVG